MTDERADVQGRRIGPDHIVELCEVVRGYLLATGLGDRSVWALEAAARAFQTNGAGVRLEIDIPAKVGDRPEFRVKMLPVKVAKTLTRSPKKIVGGRT